MPPRDLAADVEHATTTGWIDRQDLAEEVGSVSNAEVDGLDGSRISAPRRRRGEIAGTVSDRFGLRAHAFLGDGVERPKSLKDLHDLVADAIEQGNRLKIVGAARAHGVATRPYPETRSGTRRPSTRLVSTERLNTILSGVGSDIRQLKLREHSDVGLDGLVRLQAGVPVRDALRALSDQGRAIRNHGSGDFQSCVGAISTGTHGSGVKFGSVASFVRSLVVVRVRKRGNAVVPWIELIQRSTDATRQSPVFAAPDGGVWRSRTGGLDIHPVFDDDRFFAHLVGMGTMGLVYSMTLSVRKMIHLREWREPRLLVDALADLDDLNRTHRHVELVVDPYPREPVSDAPIAKRKAVRSGDAFDFDAVRCQVVRREKTFDPKSGQRPNTMEYGRLGIAAGAIGSQIRGVLKNPAENGPKAGQALIACTSVTGAGYVDTLPEVLLLNLKYAGLGAEWAVPLGQLEPALRVLLEEGCWTPYKVFEALDPSDEDALVAALEAHAPFFQGPSVRFVRGEGAWLAGSHAVDASGDEQEAWACIEVGFLGSPGLERIWRARKRHLGRGPEDLVQDHDVPRLLGKLKKRDAVDPESDSDTWVKARNLPRIDSADKRRMLRLYAAYERGRIASLKAMQDALIPLNGRPHQGLWHDLDWAGVRRCWGRTATDAWRAAFLEANPEGTFDSPLTEQWAIRQQGAGGNS